MTLTSQQQQMLNDVMRALGREGGKAAAARMTKQQRVARAKKASAASHKNRGGKR